MVAAFLLALSTLFSIVNPVGGALIFNDATAGLTHAGRVALARRVGLYSLAVMMVALWAGSYVLAFFGISMAALRIAGGLVLTGFAWERLRAPEQREGRKQAEAQGARSEDMAFFPLTLPFTTGPGTIAVSIALGAQHPPGGRPLLDFLIGVSLAVVAMALGIALLYAHADRLSALLGPAGCRTLSRLFAFLLLCIGVQVLLTGVLDVARPLAGH